MKAINHYVVVEKIKVAEKKVSGFIFNEETNKDDRYLKGRVISKGNLVECIKEDDTIWYDKHAGHGIDYEDKFYFVIRASDIVLVD